MIKQYLFIPLLFCFFAACNNNDPKTVAGTEIISAKEQSMIDAVTKYPDSLLLREDLIQYYREAADYDKAISATDAALEKDSLNDRLWDIKGNLHFENDDTISAIKAINRAADINPLPKYVIPLASMYAQTGDSIALLIADFIVQARMTETPKESYFIKGLYYNFTGNEKTAIAYL